MERNNIEHKKVTFRLPMDTYKKLDEMCGGSVCCGVRHRSYTQESIIKLAIEEYYRSYH